MSEFIASVIQVVVTLIRHAFQENGVVEIALKFISFVLLFELPYQLTVMMGVTHYWIRTSFSTPKEILSYPTVSCVITCFGEGESAKVTVHSLAHQIYPGLIEIIAVVDGAFLNQDTYHAVLSQVEEVQKIPNRRIRIIPKWQRGGKASSLNSGLALAQGEIVMTLDADTSFDNDMVYQATRPFLDSNVVGVAGCLRVRNIWESMITRMQTLEYMISIGAGKTGLSELGATNIISGAFGVFRKDFIEHIGGWDSGAAEDLDITTRIKNYFGRYPKLKIVFAPHAIGQTDVPVTFFKLLKQRLRWSGDLNYLYFRKYWRSFNPRISGWRNFFLYVWVGLFLQTVSPFLIAIYTLYLFCVYEPGVIVGSLFIVYLFYVLMSLLIYFIHVLLISERPKEDLKLFPFLIFYPAYSMMERLWHVVATLSEVFLKSHLDTSMTPWWVIRKTKY